MGGEAAGTCNDGFTLAGQIDSFSLSDSESAYTWKRPGARLSGGAGFIFIFILFFHCYFILF